VLRVAEWNGRSALLLGTDCHLSGGATEFKSFALRNGRAIGELDSPWNLPVNVTVGVSDGDALRPVRFTLHGNGHFAQSLA
jgi:hypothetical protein